MANSIVQPFTGDLVLDLKHLDGIVVDLVPGAMRGLRREKDGIQKAIGEIQKGIPAHAATIGVAQDVRDRVNTLSDQIEKIRQARVLIDKMAEVLVETEAYLEDEREGEIGLIVNAVRGAARRKDPTLLAAFEETARYHGQIAARAHKTRRKNAEQGDAASNGAPTAQAPDSPPAAHPQ